MESSRPPAAATTSPATPRGRSRRAASTGPNNRVGSRVFRRRSTEDWTAQDHNSPRDPLRRYWRRSRVPPLAQHHRRRGAHPSVHVIPGLDQRGDSTTWDREGNRWAWLGGNRCATGRRGNRKSGCDGGWAGMRSRRHYECEDSEVTRLERFEQPEFARRCAENIAHATNPRPPESPPIPGYERPGRYHGNRRDRFPL